MHEDWKSPTDEVARIAKMKVGRAHFAYQLEVTDRLQIDVVSLGDTVIRYFTNLSSR